MKNLINFLFICSFAYACLAGNSTTNWKTPIHTSHVALEVILKFNKSHTNMTNVAWYPYPYGSKQMININGAYSPKSSDDFPDYYEAAYTLNDVVFREIYNKEGISKMLVSSQNINLAPEKLLNTFKQEPYKNWDLLAYETVQFTETPSYKMHKFFLSDSEDIHVFYYDQNLVEQKHIDWEFYKTVEDKTLAENKKAANKISLEDLSWKIKLESDDKANSKKDPETLKIESWYLHEEDNLFELHEKQTASENKTSVKINELPSKLKKEMLHENYKVWSFDEEVEKIVLPDGAYDFRIHGLENNKHHVITIHTF